MEPGRKEYKMDKIEKNIKRLIMWGGWFISCVVILWSAFGYYNNISNELKAIQKLSLRIAIWSDNIPMHDRIESCDNYIDLGYNSETKKYCDKLLEKDLLD